jgi:hypothetical protein
MIRYIVQRSTIGMVWTNIEMKENAARNGTVRFKKCKQLLENKHFLLIRDIWWSKVSSILKCCSFFQCQCLLGICGSLRQLISCIGIKYVVFYCWIANITLTLVLKIVKYIQKLCFFIFWTLGQIRHLWQLKISIFCHRCLIL